MRLRRSGRCRSRRASCWRASPRRLCARGGPHYGSPDKRPQARLATIRAAGELAVPLTTGLLIGIGESRKERIEALLALRDLQDRYGHIQELIIQNFRPKADTRMAGAAPLALEEQLWTIAMARLIFPPDMTIQAPPNLRPGALVQLIAAGINDWGGVSPVTPDHVNPEAPWPQLRRLEAETAAAGKRLVARLPLYPAYHPSARALGRAGAAAPRAVARRCRWLAAQRWLVGRCARPAAASRGGASRCAAASPRRAVANPRQGTSRQGAERGGDCHAVPGARRRLRCGLRGGGRTAARSVRRCRDLCRHPQHQLHQYLRLSLPVLRLLQGQDRRASARQAL